MTTESKTDRHATRISLNPDYRRCTHLTANGRRCLDPSLSGKTLCFTHEHRRIRASMKPCPPSTWNQAPLVHFIYIEDARDVLENLNAALDSFARHAIDDRKLSALQRTFETALRGLRQMQSGEKRVEQQETILDARWDDKGNAFAIDEAAETTSSPSIDVIPSEAERSRGPREQVLVRGVENRGTCGCLSDPAQPKPPASEPSPGSGTISAISAEAEDAIPQPKPNQIVKGRSAISRLYSALTGKTKVKRLNPYTYVLEGNKMASIPASQRRCRFKQSTHRCRIYIQIPKVS